MELEKRKSTYMFKNILENTELVPKYGIKNNTTIYECIRVPGSKNVNTWILHMLSMNKNLLKMFIGYRILVPQSTQRVEREKRDTKNFTI